MPRTAVSRSRNVVSMAVASAGLTSTATRAAAGTSSCRSSSRFAVNSPLRKLMPVALPPGRGRLATSLLPPNYGNEQQNRRFTERMEALTCLWKARAQ